MVRTVVLPLALLMVTLPVADEVGTVFRLTVIDWPAPEEPAVAWVTITLAPDWIEL